MYVTNVIHIPEQIVFTDKLCKCDLRLCKSKITSTDPGKSFKIYKCGTE